MQTEKFDVSGMTCASCVSHVEKSVSRVDGVESVTVNLLTNSMVVTFDELKLSTVKIEKTVEQAGYAAHIQKASDGSQINRSEGIDFYQEEKKTMLNRFYFSAGFLIPLMYMSMAHMLGLPYPDFFHTFQYAFMNVFIQFWLVLPILFFNYKYFLSGFRSLLRLAPNMDTLIAIGVSATMLYGVWGLYHIYKAVLVLDVRTILRFTNDMYFESAGTILTLITLGKYLEARSKSRTSQAIRRLIDLAPKSATVLRHKVEMEIPVDEVVVGDIVVIRPGQQIPVDGVVYTGNSSVDESALTGESMPVFKEKGNRVLSASINKSGYFTMKATKVGKDTTLSQIISLVEEAASSKAPISKLADRVSAVFVPIVILISMIAGAYWLIAGYPLHFALSISIAVLVISCPCALGLATPVAIMVGTGKAAEYGILIKSAESLQMAREVDTIVLDKTGTLTEGKPCVSDIVTASGVSVDELVRIAASLEKPSEHPLAEAILLEAVSRKIEIAGVDYFQAIPGLGIEAVISGEKYIAGNQKLLDNHLIKLGDFEAITDKLTNEGKTPLFIASSNAVLGVIAVVDRLKSTSKEAIRQLKEMGLDVVMLTGDHAGTAAAIQSQLGIPTVIAEVLPHQKDEEISKLQKQGKIVAMVGDGINDAPALVRSDLGIAIGAGTDVAIESADIVLMRSDLLDAVTTLRLSHSVMVNIRQNLFWAFFYNVIGIPLAAGVFFVMLHWKLNPMFAAAAMSLSSVTVVLNALRLLRFKPIRPNMPADKQMLQHEVSVNSIPAPKQQKKPTVKFRFVMAEKKIAIKGMTCGHCSARVEKALNSIDGVKAEVDLASNTAKVLLSKEVTDDVLRSAIVDAGYEMTSID
jgi:Cu+-exporting ATPase